jgi:hypothetical protein
MSTGGVHFLCLISACNNYQVKSQFTPPGLCKMDVCDPPRKFSLAHKKKFQFPTRPQTAALLVEKNASEPRPIHLIRSDAPVSRRGEVSGDDALLVSHTAYGLKNWRRYAIVKHGNDPRFLTSSLGSDIVARVFCEDVQRDLVKMTEWVEQVELACLDLESELAQARADAVHASSRVSWIRAK